MVRSAAAALIVLAGCGRVGYAPFPEEIRDGAADAPPGPPDAGLDAAARPADAAADASDPIVVLVLSAIVDGFLLDGLMEPKDGVPGATVDGSVVQVLDVPRMENRGVIEFDLAPVGTVLGWARLDLTTFNSMGPLPFDVDVFGYTATADGALGLDDWSGGTLLATVSYGGEPVTALDVTDFVVPARAGGARYVGFRCEFAVPSPIDLNGPYVAWGSFEYPPAGALLVAD